MKIIDDLYETDKYLLGDGYNHAMDYINKIIPLDIRGFKSGTKSFDWEVPKEWIVRDAWVKFNGKKILDWKKNPMCLADYSIPIHKTIDVAEFKKHLKYSDEMSDAHSYSYKFYSNDWGFTMPKKDVSKQLEIEGDEPKIIDVLEEGEYEVFIDSEFVDGEMKIGVHTIKGKTDKEILLFAHLDHPYQANDNLSGVACLVDLVPQIKKAKFEHTIKLVFCPETIGSITYAAHYDISKVDFMIAVDAVGNDNTLLYQQTFKRGTRLDYCMFQSLRTMGINHRMALFRYLIGSDEYVFNDPLINIPGIMLSRFPYPEYHTDKDTPEIIKDDKIRETGKAILKCIEIYEKDFIPKRKHKGQLFRAKYDVQSPFALMNLDLDYIYYDIDGKKYLSEILSDKGISFDNAYEIFKKIGMV